MNTEEKTLEIIIANPLITYKEISQELARTVEDELQEAISDLLKKGIIVYSTAKFYKVA